MQDIIAAFERVPDPRAENRRHDLVEILMIAFLAVLCGATSCVEMASFGHIKVRFLKKFLKLEHGIPSHDTFSSVLRVLDPKAVDAAFGWLCETLARKLANGGIIAIDGKSLKRAYDKGEAHMPRMMVTAYATNLRLTLASLEAEGGNEVEAALALIGLIDLKGMIVTADALHCHRRMAQAIVDKGGGYCLRLKGNQEALLSQARLCLANVKADHPTATSETIAHGRAETRTGLVVKAPGIAESHEFPGLKAFASIQSTRVVGSRRETDTRIFALSRMLSPKALLKTARAHWAIENGLNWQLDMALNEDAARNRRDHGPANIAVLRRRAIDIARRDTSKGALKTKLKQAGWEHDFLLHLLRQMR